MNRKQKVAVVVGALVIAGLALFPPWQSEFNQLGDRDNWPTVHHGPHWAFSPPPQAQGPPRRNPNTRLNYRGYEGAKIDNPLRNNLQLAALALTVAAVVVLRERKAGA